LWPAMKPTARSLELVGVTVPDEADVLVAEVPVDPSSGALAATPLNSWSCRATADAPVVTVTLLTGAAFGAYHISPLEYWPDTS
jgi:hypothetical protein